MNTLLQRLALLTFAVAFVAAVTAHGKEKGRVWETGKVLDSDRASRYVGSVGSGSATSTGDSQQ